MENANNSSLVLELQRLLIEVISETNAISLDDTLELLLCSPQLKEKHQVKILIEDFQNKLFHFQSDKEEMTQLLQHPLSQALYYIFKSFPLKYYEEHIHLTGSLSAEFIFSKIQKTPIDFQILCKIMGNIKYLL